MSSQSPFTRTLVAIAAALVMSTVAVGAAVGPAQAVASPVPGPGQCLNSKFSRPRFRSARRVLVREPETATVRLAPVAAWLSGPVFSRARDIFAANMTEILDRAEDPARMIRMVILEMEETLGRGSRDRRALDRRHQGDAARA